MFDGQAVMEQFKVDRPDLVLLDVTLPGKDGWAILKELQFGLECPITMLKARQL